MALAVAVPLAGAAGFGALSASPAAQEHRRGLAALAASLAAFAVAEAALPGLLVALLNPLELPWWVVVVLSLVVWPAESAWWKLICWALGKAYGPLPFRAKNPGVKGHENLDWIDVLYTLTNNIVFFVPLLSQMGRLALRPLPGTSVTWRLEDIGLCNTLLAVPLLLVITDLYYYALHRLLHWRVLYPYIHKHHHRQVVPWRGFEDAVNEHPLELILGMGTLWGAMYTLARLTTLHAAGMLGFVLVLGLLSVVNHTNMDIRLNFVIFEYSVRVHETHHRFPAYNMAQYCTVWDKLLGTYRDYDELPGQPASKVAQD